jgi:hypothetical protein
MYLRNGGSFVPDSTVSSGTLRTPDLLRAFAEAYLALCPTNGRKLHDEAMRAADVRDAYESGREVNVGDEDEDPYAEDIVGDLMDAINYTLGQANLPYTFGSQEGDGACFGFWRNDEDEGDEDDYRDYCSLV